MITASTCLAVLPPYRGKSLTVSDKQDVFDIIDEVCAAHKFFSPDYDVLADMFWTGDIYDTCRELWEFCKDNITYKIEGEGSQTTKSPSALLTTHKGDCKHYAGFIGGVLDAINREFNAGIKWNYRFASYDMFCDLPQHVFIVVKDHGREIWIDPVLKHFDERLEPTSVINKKISAMALNRISGTNNELYNIHYSKNIIGWTIETSAGYTTSGPTIVPKIGDPFYGTDFLGLSRYGTPTNTDLTALTAQLQNNINEGGPEKYTLSKDLVAKVLRDNVQNWNFYYAKGTSPTPRQWHQELGPWGLEMVVTPDGRLTFSTDNEPPHNDPHIHHLVDQANYLVQAYSDEPYIVIMDHLKRLGKGWKTPESGSIWHVVHEGDVNFVKAIDLVKKIPGLNEALASVGLNINSLTDMASNLLGVNSGTGSNTGGGGGVLPTTPPFKTSSISPTVILLGSAAALYFLTRRRRVAGVAPKNLMPLLLLGGGMLLLQHKKTVVVDPGGIVPPGGTTATPPYIDPGTVLTKVPTGVLTDSETGDVVKIAHPVQETNVIDNPNSWMDQMSYDFNTQ